MWEIVQYLLNALLFVLIGLQLPVVADALGDFSTTALLGYAAAVSFTVIAVRFAWVFAVLHAPKWIARRMSNWRGAVFLSWAGMRGAVSLAAALALPLETDVGAPFPDRELILFLTFSVILATLVGQGLTLPVVIRVLGLEDDGIEEREDAKARIHAAEAALARLEELVGEEWVREDTAERMRGAYRFRTSRFRARLDYGDDGAIESRSQDYQRLRRRTPRRRTAGPDRSPSQRHHQQRRLATRRPRSRPRRRATRFVSGGPDIRLAGSIRSDTTSAWDSALGESATRRILGKRPSQTSPMGRPSPRCSCRRRRGTRKDRPPSATSTPRKRTTPTPRSLPRLGCSSRGRNMGRKSSRVATPKSEKPRNREAFPVAGAGFEPATSGL